MSKVAKPSCNINVGQTSRQTYEEPNTGVIDGENKIFKRPNAPKINIGPIDNGRPRVRDTG